MRDIVVRLTEQETALLAVMLEDIGLPMILKEPDERTPIIKPVLDSALKKLKAPLKRRKVI